MNWRRCEVEIGFIIIFNHFFLHSFRIMISGCSELGKKSALHIADQCFSSFGVSLIFPHNSVYAELFDEMNLRFASSGLDLKITNDMSWDLQRRGTQNLLGSKSKSFSMSDVEERKLNLADTEGMFLLMAIGYVMAGSVLFSEIVGGCAKSCRAFIRRGSMVSASIRRGSTFSQSQAKTFSEKFKRGLRRRLRPKSKPQELVDQIEPEEAKDEGENGGTIQSGEVTESSEPQLKGPTSFCTLKRIMLMRKHRKEEKKAAQKEMQISAIEVAKSSEDDQTANSSVNYIDLEEGAVGGEHFIIENEKCGEIGDANSLIGSASIYSDTQIIREETEAEVNHFSTSFDRNNNPSTEFGEEV